MPSSSSHVSRSAGSHQSGSCCACMWTVKATVRGVTIGFGGPGVEGGPTVGAAGPAGLGEVDALAALCIVCPELAQAARQTVAATAAARTDGDLITPEQTPSRRRTSRRSAVACGHLAILPPRPQPAPVLHPVEALQHGARPDPVVVRQKCPPSRAILCVAP